MAYGTDKLGDTALVPQGAVSASTSDDVAKLRADIDRIALRPDVPPELADIRERLAALELRRAGEAGEAR
jgi:hypothetical protein